MINNIIIHNEKQNLSDMNSVKRLILKITIATLFIFLNGFQPIEAQNYDNRWEKVDELAKKGRPRSAIELVDEIYIDAKSNNDTPQIIKSLIYRTSLQSKFEDDHIVLSIKEFEKNIKDASFPEKQILHSLTAELYNAYLVNNRWVINKRQVIDDDTSRDITTWDAIRFNKEIAFHYSSSLENKGELSNIRLSKFYPILLDGDSSNITLFPFLYDLLVNRAINYYTSTDYEMLSIGTPVDIVATEYLVPLADFLKLEIDPSDSSLNKVMALFQSLLSLHQKENNDEALVDADLRRLKFAYNKSNKDNEAIDAFILTLTKLSTKFRSQPIYVSIAYELANQYYIEAGNYSEVFSEESKYYFVIADSICKIALEEFPNVNGTNKCRNLSERINSVQLGFEIPTAQIPNQPTLSQVEFKNIDKLYFKIVKGDPKANTNRYNLKEYIQNELRQKEVKSWIQDLPDTKDHRKHTAEIKIPELPLGYYIIFASDDPSFNTSKTVKYKPLWVSNLSYITKENPAGGNTDLYILNRETGKSMGDVGIKIFQQQYNNRNRSYTLNKIGETTADKYGYALIESLGGSTYGTYIFEFEKGDDRLFSENYLNFYRTPKESKPKTTTYLFTDRAVYRPGQTVYFKGIVTEKINNSVKLQVDYPIEITFTNASRKNIRTLNLITNEAGSVDGFFIIPSDGMNGNMTIKTKSGTVSFLVEEYKRPTFEVVFDTLSGQPKLGEIVSVQGRAKGYTGNAVDAANVVYRVVRKVDFPIPYFRGRYFWIPPNSARDIEIAHGTVKTKDDGSFKINFEALPNKNIKESTSPVFTYVITADVTDITGEVRSMETSVKVGYKSANLKIDVKDEIDINDFKTPTVEATNLAGKSIELPISVSLYKLTSPTRLINERQWAKPEFNLIPEHEFRKLFPHEAYNDDDDPLYWERERLSNKELVIIGKEQMPYEMFSDLSHGEYLLTATGKDDSGKKVESQQVFTIYSTKGKKMPGKHIYWATTSKTMAEPGETIKLIVGSSTKKSQFVYEITNNKQVVERSWVSLNKGQRIIEIPIHESYRGNFSIAVAMVKYNRFYSRNFKIVVPFTNKKLDLALSTFRSFLTPGQKEEWKVTIKGNNGEKLSAELLAGMYDASLDVFNAQDWRMNLYHQRGSAPQWQSNQFYTAWSSALFVPDTRYFSVSPTNYPVINWFGYYLMGNNPIAYDNVDMLYRKSVVADENSIIDVDQTAAGGAIEKDNVTLQEIQIITEEEQKQEIIPLRTNFNETAFFYPNLRTDENGNVSFSFTTPDALTEWKIRMLAYTKDMKVGTLEQNIKSQKDLMIIPNVPRFVRQGDTLVFSAKVINFTNEKLEATSKIEFFDAITMRPISIISEGISNSMTKKINPGQSIAINWEIAIPDNLEMITYRITASTDNFSDGEERMFPVLTNRMLVTNTLPMNVNSRSTSNFDFKSLSEFDENSTKRNYKYTVEFTSNPSWYAVQAIPYLSTPQNKNNISLFNTYFANSLSAYIVNSNPKIKTVFESWKSLTPDAFMSNLQKNKELKNAVISASPWLLEAEDETEQKRRIGVLFDVTRMSQEKQSIINKLLEAQLPTGAWPWFKGMKEDRHTTQSIILGMAKLHHKGVLDLQSANERFQMVRKAVNWLDKQIVIDYKKLLRDQSGSMKKYQLRSSQVQYLYLRSLLLDIIPVSEKTEEAIAYYVGQTKKYWLNQSNMLQGLTAMTLYKFGHRNESEAIIRSLKERSLFSKEMGMYWRQDIGWNWYQAPVETQAIMIETLSELDNNPAVVEQLKIWLLKQKQTQNWSTSSATAEAVFALLMYGNKTLDQSELVKITVAEEVITDNKDLTKESGTGYFTSSWSGSEITPELSQITVENPNNNIAWGAAYWQFFEDMDKIESHGSPLSISKKLFVERHTDNGPVIKELNENTQLATGDKVVVRLIISVDRNMEYVHLKDMRATTFEPTEQISGYTYSGGLWYYKNITNVSTDFFIQYLQKGTYVLEYPLFATQKGDFTNGIATIQSMYAPEFGAHSSGVRVVVK